MKWTSEQASFYLGLSSIKELSCEQNIGVLTLLLYKCEQCFNKWSAILELNKDFVTANHT